MIKIDSQFYQIFKSLSSQIKIRLHAQIPLARIGKNRDHRLSRPEGLGDFQRPDAGGAAGKTGDAIIRTHQSFSVTATGHAVINQPGENTLPG